MKNILENINFPPDIKKLSREDLPVLAQEIREKIITTVSKTGGHLSSNLGVVDLTIALHYIFDFSKDRIIWDVGHQCYTHKILTGRKEIFDTLRQDDGLSGFPKSEESEYDSFNTGHAGTSISAAMGLAEAIALRKEKCKVIAVIGDGSMTAGMAFEALNQVGGRGTDIIVVLNDNEMSISHNVGALSSYLNRIMTGRIYTKVKEEIETLLRRIPSIGSSAVKIARRIEEVIKGLIVPGMLFQELGFQYVGPIEGHNFNYLFETFENIRKLKGPILVHVITRKGKGYEPAERNPSLFHSTSPFDISTGIFLKKSINPTYTEVFSNALIELATNDNKIVAITAAMPEGTGLDEFARRFPERFYDVGISEQHAVTFAAGLAKEGFKPITAIYSTFLQRGYDQILHDVCLQNLHVVFSMDRAGIVGPDGPTHHGIYDFSYLRHLPNMVVMAPKDEIELRDMLFTALSLKMPVSIRYPKRNCHGEMPEGDMHLIQVGKGEVIAEGTDISIVAIGSMVYTAIEAGEKLRSKGINAEVINARFIKPIDAELIRTSARKTGRLITVEENILTGGFGSAVLEALDEVNFSVSIRRMGIPDIIVEHGSTHRILNTMKLSAEGIYDQAIELVEYSYVSNPHIYRMT